MKEFIKFTKDLGELFNELEKRKLKIAITEELYNLYSCCIPTQIYSASNGMMKNAVNLFSIRFMNLIKVVHKFGDHYNSVDIDPNETENKILLSTDIYLNWLDMCGLIIKGLLLPDILRANNQISIFKMDYAHFFNDDNECVQVNIHDCLENIYNTRTFKAIRLRGIINKSVNHNINDIPCKGTGDHSSIWGKSIRKLKDVPAFERRLLTSLIETGIVKSIQFLGFENNFDSVENPVILINSIDEMTNCDVLMCTLRGKGKKQNAQDIRVETIKGTGKYIIDFFDGEITIQGLKFIADPSVAATLEEN